MIERAYILADPDPPAIEGGVVVGVVTLRDEGGRRTDFYLAGSQQSAEHLVKQLQDGKKQ